MIYFNTKTKYLYKLYASNVRYEDISVQESEGDETVLDQIDKNSPIVKSGKPFHILTYVDWNDAGTDWISKVLLVPATGDKAIPFVSTNPESEGAIKVPLNIGSDFVAIKEPGEWTDEELEKYDGGDGIKPSEISAYDEILQMTQRI